MSRILSGFTKCVPCKAISFAIVFSLAFSITFFGCTKKQTPVDEGKNLNLAIWGNYLSPELQAKFTQETGIKVHVSNYSSNEELLAKIQMGSSGIDIAVPSDYMVDIMKKMNLLEPLNHQLIPQMAEIDGQFLDQSFDPKNVYSLPYIWTTMGIAIDREVYKKPVTSWKDFFQNKDLQGKFSLLDDVREVTAAALRMHGYEVNTTDPAELKKARETLLAAKKHTKMFSSDSIDIITTKEVVAAQAYSSDALQAAAKQPGHIEYVLPKEGSTMAIDNLVIFKGAKNIEAAHKLISFLLSEESELEKVKTIYGGPVLKGTRAKLPKEFQNNKALFPDEATLKKLQRLHDLGDKNKLYEDIWLEVKTQ